MTSPTDWRQQSKCRELNYMEADEKFFPGSGGKVNSARIYCSTCPVQRTCLLEAIASGSDGFWSGTTFKERQKMRALQAEVEAKLYPVPVAPKAILKITPTKEDHQWLDSDSLEPSEIELIAIQRR